jgi:hypothetical protein
MSDDDPKFNNDRPLFFERFFSPFVRLPGQQQQPPQQQP